MRPFRRFPAVMAALLSMTCTLALLGGAIWTLATSDGVMLALMHRTAPPESSFLPEEYYPLAVSTITDYLTGAADECQFTFSMDGVTYAAFRTKEQVHMADCRALFFLCRRVTAVAALLSGALLLLLLPISGALRCFRKWLRRVVGLLILCGVVVALGFTDAFVLFHRMAFDNDLWLLNPQTNLLVRLMPTAFFEQYAALIALATLGGIGMVALMTRLLEWLFRQKHSQPPQRKKVLP